MSSGLRKVCKLEQVKSGQNGLVRPNLVFLLFSKIIIFYFLFVYCYYLLFLSSCIIHDFYKIIK